MVIDECGRDELHASVMRDGHRAGLMVALFGALCLILTNQATGLPVAEPTLASEANPPGSVSAAEGSAPATRYVKLNPSLLVGMLIVPLLGTGVGFIWSLRRRTRP